MKLVKKTSKLVMIEGWEAARSLISYSDGVERQGLATLARSDHNRILCVCGLETRLDWLSGVSLFSQRNSEIMR